MNASLRICNGNYVKHLLQINNGRCHMQRSLILKPQPAVSEGIVNYDEKNMKIKRPLSPHLLIYSPQWTSMLSITHRFTGMLLSGYTMAFGIGALVLPDTIPNYIDSLNGLGTVPIFLIKYYIALPFTYHFFNGIRHLTWDTGKFLTNKSVNTTGYIMLACAFGAAIGISVI